MGSKSVNFFTATSDPQRSVFKPLPSFHFLKRNSEPQMLSAHTRSPQDDGEVKEYLKKHFPFSPFSISSLFLCERMKKIMINTFWHTEPDPFRVSFCRGFAAFFPRFSSLTLIVPKQTFFPLPPSVRPSVRPFSVPPSPSPSPSPVLRKETPLVLLCQIPDRQHRLWALHHQAEVAVAAQIDELLRRLEERGLNEAQTLTNERGPKVGLEEDGEEGENLFDRMVGEEMKLYSDVIG